MHVARSSLGCCAMAAIAVVAAATLGAVDDRTGPARGQSPPPRAPAASSLYGEYSHPHAVTMYDAPRSYEIKTSDSLTLSASANGGLAFHLEIFATNGHTCDLEGVAAARDSRFEYREKLDPRGGDPPEDCVLRITPDRRDVIVEDVGGHCRTEYCGMRASIGRIVFRK